MGSLCLHAPHFIPLTIWHCLIFEDGIDYTADMSEIQFDLSIVGGGPTGCALALELARLAPDPSRIALLQADDISRYQTHAPQDPRVIAINEGTRVMLDDLGVWPEGACPIHTIHVSQKGRLGRTLITHDEFNVPALGYVVRYHALRSGLLQAVQRLGVSVLQDQMQSVTDHGETVQMMARQHQFDTRLAVRADGMNHTATSDRYRQTALIGRASVTSPCSGWAFERFTRGGPFAVLPHPDNDGTQSIVWCCEPATAQKLVSLDLRQFSQAMTDTFGERLGKFEALEPFQAFPLYQSLDPEPVVGRIINIGNAAQTLHPVAGQGMNLGLRDAATLSHCLRDWIAQPHRDPRRSLTTYQKLRDLDRQSTVKLTGFMSTIFTTQLPIIEHVAGLALLALDTFEGLRAPLARHLMEGLRR